MLRGPYGGSHFGSGGGWGGVRHCGNATCGHGSNGFISGPDSVTVTDPSQPARVSARGGDSIGDGRDWGEDHEWVPGHGWIHVTRDAPNPAPADREGRIAWCLSASGETGAALIAHAAQVAAAKVAWTAARAAEKAAWAAQDAVLAAAAKVAAAEAKAKAATAKAAEATAKARAIAARISGRRTGRAGSPGRCL
jgi:hypothetical protein